MDLRRFTDATALACAAADVVADVVARDPDACILLPAGGTPVPLYTELVDRVRRGVLDLERVHFFQLDELVGVAPSDPRSFAAFLRRHLLDEIPRQPGRDHLIDGAAPDPAIEIARHATELDARDGHDLALLGLGHNGHVAFNEPGSTLADGARVVELHAETTAALSSQFEGAELPSLGITLGLRELAAGASSLVLVSGASKAPILSRWLGEPEAPVLPVAHLDAATSLTVFATRDALDLTAS